MALIVDIEKTFKDFHLQTSFRAGNETMAILGASGCGKSLTLKCIAGIEKPDKGYIELDGRVLFDFSKGINLPARDRKIGYLFQDYALFPNMTVEGNISCAIPGDKREKSQKIHEIIERFYLTGLEQKYPFQLSGGQQQRVAIARMLAMKPSLLMFDEPFSALDDYLKWQLEQAVMETIEAFGGTTLLVSHNRDEVFRIAKQIVVMDQGKVEVMEEKSALFKNPKTLAATLLTGCKNISRAKRIDDYTILALDWDVVLTISQKVMDDISYVGFRSHFFKQVSNNGESNTIRCQIDKVIEDTFSMIVMFHNHSTKDVTKWGKLRYELPKDKWMELASQEELYLQIPEDLIIQMR